MTGEYVASMAEEFSKVLNCYLKGFWGQYTGPAEGKGVLIGGTGFLHPVDFPLHGSPSCFPSSTVFRGCSLAIIPQLAVFIN